jgi:uncharacterized membrane protein
MTPDQMEERVGRLLGFGTTVSTVLLAVGLGLWFAVDGRNFVQTILAAGLIVLIATPIGRVVLSTVGYAMQRDWAMVGLTALVLAALTGSLVVAMRRS